MRTLRRWAFRLHGWVGLALSLAFVMMALTGALLVFGAEIDAVAHPATWTRGNDGATPFAAILAGVQAARPDADLLRIERGRASWLSDIAIVRGIDGRENQVWTAPGSGAVVAAGSALTPSRLIKDFHESLFVPLAPARVAVAALAPVLLAMLIGGLVTYRRFWRGWLRFPSRGQATTDWLAAAHRVTALWLLPFLVVLAFTGSVFFFREIGLAGPGPAPQPPLPRSEVQASWLTPDALSKAEAAAVTAAPGLRFTKLTLPLSAKDGLIFEGAPAGAALAEGGTTVSVDPLSGDILGMSAPKERTGVGRIEALAEALHFGRFAGLGSRVLWLVFAVGLAGLALSGGMRFGSRRRPGQHAAAAYLAALGPMRWLYALALVAALAAALARFA